MQKVWITGASSGIGEALAKKYAARGAALVLSARGRDELERVAVACRGLGASEVLVLPLDLAKSETFATIVEQAFATFGYIDVMVHNGGVSQRSLVLETELSVDRRIMEINFFGAVALTKLLLPHFVARGAGHFVVVSSVVGKFGTPYRSAYAASKHALHGFFDSLRAELSPKGVLVTILCPGFVRTAVTRNALTGDGSKLGTDDGATREGLDVDVFVDRAMRAIDGRVHESYIGRREKWGVYLKRFFPAIFDRVIVTAKVR